MKPPSPTTAKRKVSEKTISPPPLKRKTQSSISKGAVASFFTPASQKPKDRTTWSERAPDEDTPPTLLIGRYDPAVEEENVGAGAGAEAAGSGAGPDGSRRGSRPKIAAFDLDSTLIVPASGKRHSADAGDWKWWDPAVPERLRRLHRDEGFRVVVLSNQAGLTLHPEAAAGSSSGKGGGAAAGPPKNVTRARTAAFKQKCGAVLAQLDLPGVSVYAATGRDRFRKPRVGMWAEVCADYAIPAGALDLAGCVFVGDAGGRTAVQHGSGSGSGGKPGGTAKDFSCSDRNLAHNLGIAYQTPEEFFLGEPPREFARDFDLAAHPFPEEAVAAEVSSPDSRDVDGKRDVLFEKANDQDVVLFCGPPGAGKSTFYWRHLKPLGYERVNQDSLKTRAKCFKVAAELLAKGNSIAIDNTNRDASGRKEWVEFARARDLPIRCVWFKTPRAIAEHNDAVRALNRSMNPEARAALPQLAFNGFYKNLQPPDAAREGFRDVVPLDFRFRGSRAEYDVWARYWT
ncbi:PNK3P-domain-containing protein [Xylariaceae sp. FL0804]|nr:PNK3P-domain-containing protein [Xylariaceae sp. FL0804]